VSTLQSKQKCSRPSGSRVITDQSFSKPPCMEQGWLLYPQLCHSYPPPPNSLSLAEEVTAPAVRAFDGPACIAVDSHGLTASSLILVEYLSSCTYVLFITIDIMPWWRYVEGQIVETFDALTHILCLTKVCLYKGMLKPRSASPCYHHHCSHWRSYATSPTTAPHCPAPGSFE
jgi:hypothetical protein